MLGAVRIIIVSAALAVPALAQQDGCELHIWPAGAVKGISQGWMWNNTIDQTFDSARGGTARPESFDAPTQLAVLEGMDLGNRLRLPPVIIVPHPEPLSRLNAALPQRHSTSQAECYAELIVMQNVYDRAPMAATALKTLFMFRRFGTAPEPTKQFSTWADRTLLIYPPKTPEAEGPAAAEIVAAFADNVARFTDFATTPPIPAKGKSSR